MTVTRATAGGRGGRASGRGGLREHDPGHDHGAAAPPERTEPVAGERVAEDRRPDGLEREDERRPRRARLALRPGLDEKPERAREDARHEQRAPDRPAVRHGGSRDRREREPDERDHHLDEREGDRVVPGRVALHQHDLERVDGRRREHEQVAARRPAVDAGEHREPAGRKRHSHPRRCAHPEPEEHQGKERRQDDVHPGDEAGARDARPLEPERLEDVARGEQAARERRRPSPLRPRLLTRPAPGDSVREAIAKRRAKNGSKG